jgi:uncharacterized protein YndB with AHSA1/START domain
MADAEKLVIERIFDAPVERVWKAWTDPAELAKWWGPRSFISPDNTVDLRVGGRINLSMKGVGELAEQFPTVMYSGGVFTEIVEYKKLVYTDSFTDKDGNPVPPETYGMPADLPEQGMEITVIFESLPDGKTKMTLSHAALPKGEFSDQTLAGWNESFDKLAESLQ